MNVLPRPGSTVASTSENVVMRILGDVDMSSTRAVTAAFGGTDTVLQSQSAHEHLLISQIGSNKMVSLKSEKLR